MPTIIGRDHSLMHPDVAALTDVCGKGNVERRGWGAVMEDIIAEASDGPEYLFIFFDIDVLDPAFVPGTGTPEPGGLTPREGFPIVRRLCAENNVVRFVLVELNPLVDPTYVSAMNANRIVRECLTGMAMRKMGLTDGLSQSARHGPRPVVVRGRAVRS